MFIEEDEFDWGSVLDDPSEPESICKSPERACGLLSLLISNKAREETVAEGKAMEIKALVDELLGLLREDAFPGEIEAKRRIDRACSYLNKIHKLEKLNNKTVISLGGKFSAGKSKFINAISGMKQLLPEAQEPTTSIPTYIIKGKANTIRAMSAFGYTRNLTDSDIRAMTHEFYETYSIGFASFVDSIIVETVDFALNPGIALLDTPGYNKADGQINERRDFSDKKLAFEQLKTTDYLIWLVDLDNGGITENDLCFLRELNIETPVLIVFTKADKKTEREIQNIIASAETTIENSGLNCFGITAYSSYEQKEYCSELIKPFFEFAMSENRRCNDIIKEFESVEDMLIQQIMDALDESEARCKALRSIILNTPNPTDIQALSELWGAEGQLCHHYEELMLRFTELSMNINERLKSWLGGN